jgi:hypothetical protein
MMVVESERRWELPGVTEGPGVGVGEEVGDSIWGELWRICRTSSGYDCGLIC